MSETTQFPPVYPAPQQVPQIRRPRRWPWIAGIAVALVVGIAVGNGTGATSRNTALSATTTATSAAKASAASTPLPTTTVAPPVTTTVIPAPAPAPVAPAPTHRTATRTQAAPVAPPAAPVAAAPTVLYSNTGTGIGSTPDFTTGAEWQVQYTFDCAGFGQQGNFAVTDDAGDVLVNALAANGSDVAYVHASPGTHSLSINSECDWTVKVIG